MVVVVALLVNEHDMPAPLLRRAIPHHRTDARARHDKTFCRQLLKCRLRHYAAYAKDRTQFARRRNLVSGRIVAGHYGLAKAVHHLVEQRPYVVAVD